MEETKASAMVSEGEVEPFVGVDHTKDGGQVGPDGYSDQPAYPQVISCTV